MTLPLDISRCHAADCPLRESCLRWLNRESSDLRAVHTDDLREDGTCGFYMKYN